MAAGDFIMAPASQTAPAERLALCWAANPKWTKHNLVLSLDNTKPVDSCLNLCISGTERTEVIPLAPKQARELAHELIIRADLIDPNGAGESRG